MSKEDIADLVKRVEILESIVLRADNKQANNMNDAKSINFNLNERAFASKYAKDRTPAQRFAILVAFHAKGNISEEVSLKQVQDSWKRMTAIIKNFNRKYTTEAKTQGLVDSPRASTYQLGADWKAAFDEEI